MKIEFTQDVEVSGTADVSIDDISIALGESFRACEYAGEKLEPGDKVIAYIVGQHVNTCYQALAAVTEKMRAEVSSENRKIISDSLRNLADNWA